VSWEAWFTLAVIVVVMVILVRDLYPPSAAFMGGLVALLAVGVLEPAEAFSGFSNPAPITIAAVYVLARGVEKTGLLRPIVSSMLGSGTSERSGLVRMAVPTTASSAFMNTTPIVAILTPQVEAWTANRGWSASKFLMPLSFAAILGGVTTVIGTATNLVVSGLFEASGLEPLGFFEISQAGIPIAIVGLTLIVLLAPIVLPARRSVRSEAADELRGFTTEMVVVPGGVLDGKTVEDGGLRHLNSVFLVQMDRDGEVTAPVTPELTLQGGDALRFVGQSDQVAEIQSLRGLESAEHDQVISLEASTQYAYFEAVIGEASPLVGRTLKEAGFRSRYQGAVVAIHRAGQFVDAKLGSVRLRVGDTLLIISDPGFRDRWHPTNHFLLIAPLDATPPIGTSRALIVAGVIASVAVLAATGAMELVAAVLLGAVALVITKVLSPREALAAVNLDVVIMIAAAIGGAQAMVVSGLAEQIADLVVDTFSGLGGYGLLLGVVLATVLLRELITNNAAALLIFPIAVTTAVTLGLEPRAFGMGVALTAATTFLTPIGYQTNLMVYGPGGYKFTDYLRLGAPLTVATVILIMILVPIIWPF
jgi:di/tricarboxylate transporter